MNACERKLYLARTRAFTLIELLLVMVILGILAAIVLPNVGHHASDARIAAARTQISTFKTAFSMFEIDNGFLPRGKDGLSALVRRPSNAPNWRARYLDAEIPRDPWGNAYLYDCPGRHNPDSYDVMSMGPDGRAGTDDDIGNWEAALHASQ